MLGLERGLRSSIWALGTVRGRRFGPWARSAVVNLGLGRGPRSAQFEPGARAAVADMGRERGLAVAQSSISSCAHGLMKRDSKETGPTLGQQADMTPAREPEQATLIVFFCRIFGRGTGPRDLEMAAACLGAESQVLATILDPFRTIFDDLGPNRLSAT